MKKKLTLFSIFTLLFLLAFPTLTAYRLKKTIPSDIYLTQDKNVEIDVSRFVLASAKSNSGYSFNAGKVILSCPENSSYDIDLKLFGILPVKTLTVSSSENEVFMPSGEAIGIKLYTDGVLVIGITKDFPAYSAGIKEGDVITHINGVKVLNTTHFSALINENKSEMASISFMRNSSALTVEIAPVFSEDEYKIGAWVRDSSAGIGTITYVSQNGNFASLGHGICDIDTGKLLTVMQGSITDCEIVDTKKGESGSAGKLCGILKGTDIGILEKNTNFGVYGQIDASKVSLSEPMPIATRFEISEGSATILSTVDSEGPKEYSVYIEKVNTADEKETSMVIKVDDEELISKTGGIVQGMSGSPIIQNGRLIGAVTHVFLDDPTRGYGIFIEKMLAEAE